MAATPSRASTTSISIRENPRRRARAPPLTDG
jgi:hypothetical protein